MLTFMIFLPLFIAEIFASDLRSNGDMRIVGGTEVNITQNGWQVSVQLFGSHYCGGVVINKDWILTAGHCIENEANADRRFSVRVGSSASNKGGKIFNVAQAIIHPKFNKYEMDFDIALLGVSKSISFTPCTIRPIQLLDAEVEIPAGTMLTVTGWGSRTNGGDIVDKLRSAKVPVVDRQICNDNYAPNNGITDNMLCAGYTNGGTDACFGDSGGPLFNSDRVLVGIVSWGRGCANPNKPGVYTSIAAPEIRKFIKQHTNL